MGAWRTLVVIGLLMGASLAALACSKTDRFQVLRFFFDGVPDPDAAPSEPARHLPAAVEAEASRPAIVVHRHPPYRDQRCRECHNPDSRLLLVTPKEGLCQTCHQDVPGDVGFVHGPVAQGDCVACHHYHYSAHPQMLHEDPKTLCLGCHDAARLTEGPFHEEAGQRACTDCHSPHGGADRFFLDRNER